MAKFKPAKAKEIGLIDEVLPTVEELVPAAKAWIKANPDAHEQPWDKKGYKMPGGTPASPGLAAAPFQHAADQFDQMATAGPAEPAAAPIAAVAARCMGLFARPAAPFGFATAFPGLRRTAAK